MTDLLLHTDTERLTGSQKVIGSIPIFSTLQITILQRLKARCVRFGSLFFDKKQEKTVIFEGNIYGLYTDTYL